MLPQKSLATHPVVFLCHFIPDYPQYQVLSSLHSYYFLLSVFVLLPPHKDVNPCVQLQRGTPHGCILISEMKRKDQSQLAEFDYVVE